MAPAGGAWKQVSWASFSRQLLDSTLPDVLVLVGPAARLRQVDWLNGTVGLRRKTMVVLPSESSRDDLEFALSVADDLTLSSERPDLFQLRVCRLLELCGSETASASENLIAELAPTNLVGTDPTFLRTAGNIAPSARTDLPVLILGETGTGKEMFARAIHFISRRRNQPFIPVDCGGIPDHLFENEVFGHVRGAYTDAHADQRGLAAAAEGGTLFLDEVDSLSPGAQSKLLRFLQERQFKALGSEKWTRSDVRIVAASNRDLTRQVSENQFRQDLFFRLDVLRLELPPLRDRPKDIPLLAQRFLAEHQTSGGPQSFSAAAIRRLSLHTWPGNVRELLNVVQRAIVFSKGVQIDACDIVLSQERHVPDGQDFRAAREETIDRFEREYVQELLLRHHGNVTHAAREARKERRAFGRLVKKYGLRANTCAAGQF